MVAAIATEITQETNVLHSDKITITEIAKITCKFVLSNEIDNNNLRLVKETEKLKVLRT